MSARQYKAFSYEYKNIPLIIYPVKDECPLTVVFNNADEIKQHIESLYDLNPQLIKRSYHILFVWNLENKRMTDVWIHYANTFSDSGPLLECHTFKDLEKCNDAGIASGDSVIALGREEELRRELNDLKEYVDRNKCQPKFPEGMQPVEAF